MTRRFSRLTKHFRRQRLVLETLERRDVLAFVTPPIYPAGTNPTAMVADDFNSDGLQDIAVTNQTTPGKVNVLPNTGSGMFGSAVSFPTGGTNPRSLVAGDFNGDGRLDLVVANTGSGTVALLRGSGTGLFRRPIAFAAGTNPWDVAATDLNNDGALDLVLANNNTSGTVTTLINNGIGAFSAGGTFNAGGNPRAITVADFDADGNADVAVANSSSSSAGVFLGRGDGTLKPMVSYGVGAEPYGVASGDFDADGTPDLAVAHHISPGVVSVLVGNGDGSLTFLDYEVVADYAVAVRVGDVTGDGRDDVVTVHESWAMLSLLTEPTGGNFLPPQYLVTQDDAVGLALADLDNDGTLDFAATTTSGSGVAVMLSSDPSYSSTVADTVVDVPRGLTTGDVDADGDLDLMTVNTSNSSLSAMLGNGDGSFQMPIYTVGPNIGSPGRIELADFNNDGRMDAVVPYYYFGATVFLGNGDGTFGSPTSYDTEAARTVVVADFDDDGNNDFAVGEGTHVFLGNGDGTFGSPVSYGLGTWLALGDFNEDAIIDIASDGPNTHVSVRFGNGDGTFQAPINFAVSNNSQDIVTGDFDADGNLDIATQNAGIGSFKGSILLGNGNGTFQPFVEYSMGGNPADLVAADLDSDGFSDLAGIGFDTADSDVIVLLGNGDGSFDAPITFTSGPPAENILLLTVGDFNADGAPDLATASDGPIVSHPIDRFNTVSVLFNAADWPPLPIDDGPRPLAPLDAGDTTETLHPTTTLTQTSRGSTINPVDDNATAIAIRPKYGSRDIARVAHIETTNAVFDAISRELT